MTAELDYDDHPWPWLWPWPWPCPWPWLPPILHPSDLNILLIPQFSTPYSFLFSLLLFSTIPLHSTLFYSLPQSIPKVTRHPPAKVAVRGQWGRKLWNRNRYLTLDWMWPLRVWRWRLRYCTVLHCTILYCDAPYHLILHHHSSYFHFPISPFHLHRPPFSVYLTISHHLIASGNRGMCS